MSIQYLVGFVVALFALSVLTEPLARWLRLPQALLLVVFGAAGTFLVTDAMNLDTGLRAISFHDLVFYVFLPVLVFTAAYHLPVRQLAANLGIILFFAIGGMPLTAVLSAALVFWGIGHPSGFPWIAERVAGLLLARTVQREDGPKIGAEVGFTFDLLAYAANGSVFLLVGMTITGAMFTERWLAMLIAIGAVLVARAVVVFGASPVLNAVAREPIAPGQQAVIVWGGLRGAVTLALALPTTLDDWWTIQSMAFGVVLFTLFVQAPTMPWLIRRAAIPQAEHDGPQEHPA